MAEQEPADTDEAMAAAMAAAAVADDIDSISGQRREDRSQTPRANQRMLPWQRIRCRHNWRERGNYLSHGERTVRDFRARSLRLQPEDLIVAIDGLPFHKDIETFLDVMFECDPENGRVLTIWCNGVLFNVVARGPLAAFLNMPKPMCRKRQPKISVVSLWNPSDLCHLRGARDIYRNCIVLDTRLSPMAMIFPPLWLMQNRLWEVMIAVFLIYGSTLAVHWVLFVIAYVVLGMYFRKAHLVLRRSFAMMRGRHIWLVVAETSEHATQRLCRRMDPKCVFVPDLVGPPVVDEPPKKRRRRRG